MTSVVCEFVALNELIALGDFTEIVLDIQCLILLTSFDPDVSFLGGRDGDGHLWCCASYRKYGDDVTVSSGCTFASLPSPFPT